MMSLTGNIFVPLLLLHLASGVFGAVFLPLDDKVMADQEHNFICKSSDKKPISSCYFEVPGFNGEIKLLQNVQKPRFAFAGLGLQQGECGLRLRPVHKNNTGQFKCKLILDDYLEQTAEAQVDVLYPVELININSNLKANDYEYKEKDLMQITCTADGNPQPKITLFIGDEKESVSQGSTLVFETKAKPEYHNKNLKCEAEQPQLNHQITVDRKLIVSFAPRLEGSNEVTVSDGKATVQVWSHPPTKEHRNRLTRNGADVNVKPTILKDEPITEYSWPIENETDFKADWSLEVSNSVGTAVFNLTLVEASTSDHKVAPDMTPIARIIDCGSLNVGFIAGLVVFVLLLLGLAVAGVILLREKPSSYNDLGRKTSEHEKL